MLETIGFFMLAVFVLIYGFSLGQKKIVGKNLALFRVLFPSWRFFEESGHHPKLFIRQQNSDGSMGPWQDALTPPKRRWSNLFLNPQGNLFLAQWTLVDQLINELDLYQGKTVEQFSHCSSYQLMFNLVCHLVPPGQNAFQFQIRTYAPGQHTLDQDMFTSLVHQV